MAIERITQYECSICGRKIDVTRTGDVYEEPVYCCGLETAEVNRINKKVIKKKTTNVFNFPEELPVSKKIMEGAKKAVTINAYERSTKARKECIEHWGAKCKVCDIDFGKRYGKAAKGFIHVHHVVSIAAIGKAYKVNPKKDLVPVCPNCHAVMHFTEPPLTVAKVRAMMKLK